VIRDLEGTFVRYAGREKVHRVIADIDTNGSVEERFLVMSRCGREFFSGQGDVLTFGAIKADECEKCTESFALIDK